MPKPTAPIRFDALLFELESSTILKLPQVASGRLPSRGQVAVRGTIDGCDFEAVIEPDGAAGHWMRVDESLQRAARLEAGATATLAIEPAAEWPEPTVPSDLRAALGAAPPSVRELWGAITPMARWEWVRWVNATNNPDTRRRRVEVSISKMKDGKRRPCCFDLAACTDPALARSGKLRSVPPTPSATRRPPK